MPTAAHLVAFDEFQQIPDPSNADFLELHFGEVVRIPVPPFEHFGIQARLNKLLSPRLRHFGQFGAEFPFRALPEYEARRAHDAVLSWARFRATPLDDCLRGAPDLTVEVVTSSTRTDGIPAKRQLCLANRCLEFWVVHCPARTVEVSRVDGSNAIYGEGDTIPLATFGGADLPVSPIFDIYAQGEA
ncbi:MAG: Uma2 family endonuclease [Bryobacteraceae bacterium]